MKRLYFVCVVILGVTSAKAGVFPDCSYSPPPGWNSAAGDPVFVAKPRLSDDRSLAITRAAVESHRLSSATCCLHAGGYRLLLRRQSGSGISRTGQRYAQMVSCPLASSSDRHNGREFTHGLTGERLSRTRELAATQSSSLPQFRCWSL